MEGRAIRSHEIIGLVVLIVVVSAGVYSYMDYQEKRRLQESYEAYLQEIDAKEQAWDEEVAYFEEFGYIDLAECPGHMVNFYYPDAATQRFSEERSCFFSLNEEYPSFQWANAVFDYYEPKIRNVTSVELREEIHQLVKHGCENPRLGTYGPFSYPNPADVDVNIDSFEQVIFIVRGYIESIDEEPFEGWLIICWRP